MLPGNFTASTNIIRSGFIAQEVEQAAQASGYASSMVRTPSNAHDPYGLNYSEFVVALVKAVQQLDSINKLLASRDSAMEERINLLEQIVNTCCNQNHRPSGSVPQNQGENMEQQNVGNNEFPVRQSVQLASSLAILYQNQPNPFDNSTTIRYFIPDNTSQPKIIFQDETGRTIKEISITEKGQGSILVNSELLNAGVSTYSLQIAGKIVDSLKMVKTN